MCGAETLEQERNEKRCDTYTVIATNSGGAATNGTTVTIVDRLPAEMTVQRIEDPTQRGSEVGFEFDGKQSFPCAHTVTTVTCTFSGTASAGDVLIFKVYAQVKAGAAPDSTATNSVTVEGGGAPPAASSTSNPINASVPTPFGVQRLTLTPYGVDGALDPQAGDHPYALTSSLELNTLAGEAGKPEFVHPPVQDPKNVVVYLPLGLVGDALAARPRCTEAELAGEQHGASPAASRCPAASRVGTLTLDNKGDTYIGTGSSSEVSAIYNMEPEHGYPAAFGFVIVSVKVVMYASVVYVPGEGYMLRVAAPGILRGEGYVKVSGITLTFFGDPGQADGGGASEAFFTNPVDCQAGPLKARVETDSWEAPGRWASAESTVYPSVTGCNLLQFDPELESTPETSTRDEPSGWTVDLRVPQALNVWPDLATAELKDATVALPEGVSVSPSAADGLAGCLATGPEGIDMPGGAANAGTAGEGEALGPDGLSHLTAGHCPAKSQIGEVQIKTPLLEEALEGHLYVAQPECSPCSGADARDGRMLGLYLEAAGSGVVLKLKGSVSANPSTGQLTAHFDENPELPFSELKLHIDGGQRAPLATPQSCGTATTTSDLVPWSSPQTPDATPAWPASTGGCVTRAFAPGFLAQSQNARAGAFTPFEVSFSRQDGEQDLSGIQIETPPGLAGMLAKVPLCGEPQASLGTCSAASRIGTSTVQVGAGSHPYGLGGQVYLTGPYNGAPFGLSIAVPAEAGPFKLAADTGRGVEVVRAAISVDPYTSAITITSDPLPQSLEGVPLRLRRVTVTVDRPGFMFNPTNCRAQKVSATIASAQGTAAHTANPFAVEGCSVLPFKPRFSVSTNAHHSRSNGESLHVTVRSSAGQSNIAMVHVLLPKQLPSRISTLNQACPAAQFAADPAGCPSGSFVGSATAYTPLLPVPLRGPAIFVSHGGAAFPDLDIVLQGEGVTVILTGNTFIENGITTSTFASVPDVPVTRFDLVLPAGPHSALAGNGDLCFKTLVMHNHRARRRVKLVMPTTITGQNGAVTRQSTRMAVSGCARAKPKRKAGQGRATEVRQGNHRGGGR